MATNLRVLSNIKTNLKSSVSLLTEFALFNIFTAIVIYALIDNFHIAISLFFLFFSASVLLLYFVGKKREKELKDISGTISNIRKNVFLSADEIVLQKNLGQLQKEIKLMFEKAKTDIDYLKKLERMRTEFVANVSHELRTPIFAIQGYIETLLNGAIDDEKVNHYFLEKANQHTLNLNNLLNDLIDISMIESGEMRMSFRYFNANEFLQSIVNDSQLLAEEKNLKLIFHPAKNSLQVFGDKAKLRQVLVNLITNAVKYTEEGNVEVLVTEEGRFARIIVKDTGIGISEEDMNRIFERFYRVDKARSRSVGGTGLGLAIVKHIIDAHSSKVEVNSTPGIGSEFSFLLKK